MNRMNCDVVAPWRQMAITFLIAILVGAPTFVIAHPQEPKKPVQENRGIKVPDSSTSTPESDQQLNAIKKPEVVIQSSHSKPVNTIAFSPDGTWLASGSNDDTLRVWDEETERTLLTFEGHRHSNPKEPTR